MSINNSYLNALKDLNSIDLVNALYDTSVLFSCVDITNGITKAFLTYSQTKKGCFWTNVKNNDSYFKLTSSRPSLGSFLLTSSTGEVISNIGSMIVDPNSRGFVFKTKGVFGELVAVEINAEDNSSSIPDSGLGFTDEIIQYISSGNKAVLSISINVPAQPLIGKICIEDALGSSLCTNFCSSNFETCKNRKLEYCSTSEGAGSQTCKIFYMERGIVNSSNFDDLLMRNAMIENCFNEYVKSGATLTDFMNNNIGSCACFMSDQLYDNMAKNMGEQPVNSRQFFPACASNTSGKIVNVTNTGSIVNTVTPSTAPSSTAQSNKTELRNKEIFVAFIFGIILLGVIIYAMFKKS